MDQIEPLLQANAHWTASSAGAAHSLPAPPSRRIAVVTCMDSRIDVLAALGLQVGEAHILRNAGGIVTDDVLRSLALSQRRLGTTAVMLVHHTRCGLENLDEAELIEELIQDAGSPPAFAFGSFGDLDGDVRDSIGRVRESPLLLHRDTVRGFVYDVDTGALREVEASSASSKRRTAS